MRIIAGKAKGISLAGPSWQGTRPMMDKVREALFSILQWDIKGKEVLDLYAGTGALGLEALSRGASGVDFVDLDKRCCSLIKKNASQVGLNNTDIKIYQKDVALFLKEQNKKWEIIFFTPPYALFDWDLVSLAGQSLVSKGILVVEYPVDNISPRDLPLLELVKDSQYGQTGLLFYLKEKTPE